jgi:nitroreductase
MNTPTQVHPEILPVIRERRSVRRFDPRPVEREKLLVCVEAARLAPSAENAQPCRFVIIDDREIKKAFGETAFSGLYQATRWALNAPAIAAIVIEQNFTAGRLGPLIQGTPYHFIDVGIAGEHFVLQAQALGLGTCWIGWFDARKARKFLHLPRSIQVAQLIAMGYPSAGLKERPLRRKALEDIVSFNRGVS